MHGLDWRRTRPHLTHTQPPHIHTHPVKQGALIESHDPRSLSSSHAFLSKGIYYMYMYMLSPAVCVVSAVGVVPWPYSGAGLASHTPPPPPHYHTQHPHPTHLHTQRHRNTSSVAGTARPIYSLKATPFFPPCPSPSSPYLPFGLTLLCGVMCEDVPCGC